MSNQEHPYFFTILLTDRFVQTALVSNNGQGVQIKEISSLHSYADRRNLLEQLDKSFQELGPESEEVVETIFAIDQMWLDNGEVKEEYKPILQEITEELSLEAVGQVSIVEGLSTARLIGNESDSCLLLLIDEENLQVIFLKHGQLLEVLTVGRSDDVAADFTEVLARLVKHIKQAGSYFPPKILLTSLALNQKVLQSLHDDLQKVDWTANQMFVQAPSIVVLEHDYMIKSIALSTGRVLTKTTSTPATVAAAPTAAAIAVVDEVAPVEEILTAEPTIEDDNLSPAAATATSFGISFNQTPPLKQAANLGALNSMTAADEVGEIKAPPKVKIGRKSWRQVFNSPRKMIAAGIASGVLALLILAALFAVFFSRVKVELQPAQQVLSKSTILTLDPTVVSSDLQNSVLKASLESKNIQGQDVAQTTGIALVGDKAKGKAKIFNKTKDELELKQGTLLSTDKAEFFTDEAVKVPAAVEKSGGTGMDYGSVEVALTAKDIGVEANINKETRLRVADYFDDKLSATSVDNFSGGSSREVRVVSQTDQDNLLKNLTLKLIGEANKELIAESVGGVYLLPTNQSKVLESEFSAEVGDETDSVNLDLKIEVKALKYLAADLKQLAQELLKTDLKSNYAFINEDPEIMSDPVKQASNSAVAKLQVQLSAKAMAQLDMDQFRQDVAGLPKQQAEDFLSKQAQLKSSRIIFQPMFLSYLFANLPKNPQRIDVEIVP